MHSKGQKTILAVVLIQLVLFLLATGTSLYGVVLAFSASLLVGVVFLFCPPLFFISGLVMLVSNVNIPQVLADLFK